MGVLRVDGVADEATPKESCVSIDQFNVAMLDIPELALFEGSRFERSDDTEVVGASLEC